MSTYLSRRKRNDGINFYAVTNSWDFEKKTQKKLQIFIGSFIKGHCRFNDKAMEYADLFCGTEYERSYWLWRDMQAAEQSQDEDPLVLKAALRECESKNAGLSLLLDNVGDTLNLRDCLSRVFGDSLASRILSMAYYCAAEGRQALSRVSVWFDDHVLPFKGGFSQGMIEKTLVEITSDDILTFLTEWMKIHGQQEQLSYDITSVSSYAQNVAGVAHGYNRDRENLPQINLLMLVGQKSKLPLWFDQLPGAISDVTTLKDTMHQIKSIDVNPLGIVMDRGFASIGNIECLLNSHIKFTMGLALHRFEFAREMIDEARASHAFCEPGSTLDLFEEDSLYQTQAVTRLYKINGHRTYLHLYYTDFYHAQANAILMSDLREVERKLKHGESFKSASEEFLAKECYTVKTTPKRGLQVKANVEAIDRLRDNHAGYFAILSSQFKDPLEAMRVYKLRDGIEKRFDDLKNDEDCKRIRVHSEHNMRSRLFIQFIAQILRCKILTVMQSEQGRLLSKSKTVTDVLWNIEPLRRIKIEGHRPFYRRPTKAQVEILKCFGIPTDTSEWPSMR